MKRLKKANLKVTIPRLKILSLLDRYHNPLSAEEIFHKLNNTGSSCNLATVYRTLETFYSKQLINKITTPQFSMAKFEIVSQDHHHFTCTICKKNIDIPHCYIQPIIKELKTKKHMVITGHTLEFFGVCTACQ